MAEICLPVGQRLEPIHHRTVVTVGGRAKDGDEDEGVHLPQPCILKPPFLLLAQVGNFNNHVHDVNILTRLR